MKFDYSTIEDKFNSLPDEVKFAMTSPQVSENIKEISGKFGLLLDQMDVLFDVTSYVMLGLIPQKDFSSVLAKELNIGEKQAKIITTEISDKVFSSIRESMRQYELQNQPQTKTVQENYSTNSGQFGKIEEEKVESPHADLESAGNFKIETETPTELELMRERKEYMEKQRAMDMQKMVSNIPKNEPIPTTNQNKTENTVDESPKIVTQPKIEKETVIQQPSPLNKLEIPKEKEEIKVPEEPIKVEEKSNFDPFSYYNFNSTEESSDVNNDTEEGESAVGQVDNEPENIESDENKIADEQNKDSFESEEEDKEDNIGIKNEEDKVGESALNTDNTDKKDVRIKKEVEIPANLPIVEEKPETTIPNQPIIEPKILEEAVKKEVEKVKTNPVVEETIKAIENVEQTPKESINLLDKSVAKSNVSEPETNKESGIEELRMDIREQVRENNGDFSQKLVNANNITKAERMLEDKDLPQEIKSEQKNDPIASLKPQNIPNPVRKIDPYREPIE
jgi:hypothetical protein